MTTEDGADTVKINTAQRSPDFLAASRRQRTPRPRRAVPPRLIPLLAPVMRHSTTRDAYVLRLVGGRFGPVLIPRADPPPASPALELTAPSPPSRR